MVRCTVLGCKSDSGKKIAGLPFHSFPAKPESRELWIKATKKNYWVPKKISKICSQHFHKTSFMKVGNKTYLHPEAIPVEESNACIPSSSSISLHEETNMEIENNLSILGSNKMSELEQRQEQLLKKLDTLYNRIKMISSHCKESNIQDVKTSKPGKCLPAPEEVVLVLSPDSLPWYLNVILKESSVPLNISWHIHSSVPNEKVPKIKNYVKHIQASKDNSKINLRLIFKCVSADTELKLSTLDVPIVGNVNILRYLSYVYPSVIPYTANDPHVDYLLDLCHMLERTPEKNKEVVVMKLFSQQKNWIYGNEFSIVDLAAYNVIKQWKNVPKYVPKPWLDKCDKLFL